MAWARLRRWNFWSWESTESGHCGVHWPPWLQAIRDCAAWITRNLRLAQKRSGRRSKSGDWKLRALCCPGARIDSTSMNVTFGCVLDAKRSAKSGRISRVILLDAIQAAIVASAFLGVFPPGFYHR